MQIDGSGRASGATLGAPSTQATQTDFGPEAFMRLLVTQIRNQDPMQPMDTQNMMQQLTQLTEVERLVAIDDRLAGLQIATAGVANAQASDLVGTTVEADTSSLYLGELGPVEGSFQLDGAAADVRVEVRDASGRVVRTLSLGEIAVGQRTFTWDGNDDAGNRLPVDRYTVSITATDANGEPVESRTRVQGTVRAVTFENGYPALSIGESEVMMGDVRSIARPEPTSNGSGTQAPGTQGSAAR